MNSIPAKDLTKEAPSSPRIRVGGYVILARALDKGRAAIAGTSGEYHFDCPLDQFLFGFKGVTGTEISTLLEAGNSDEEVASWIDAHGTPKTEEEKVAWSDGVEASRPFDHPDKKDWFVGVCAEAGIDPAASTLFDYLEADDQLSFAQ